MQWARAKQDRRQINVLVALGIAILLPGCLGAADPFGAVDVDSADASFDERLHLLRDFDSNFTTLTLSVASANSSLVLTWLDRAITAPSYAVTTYSYNESWEYIDGGAGGLLSENDTFVRASHDGRSLGVGPSPNFVARTLVPLEIPVTSVLNVEAGIARVVLATNGIAGTMEIKQSGGDEPVRLIAEDRDLQLHHWMLSSNEADTASATEVFTGAAATHVITYAFDLELDGGSLFYTTTTWAAFVRVFHEGVEVCNTAQGGIPMFVAYLGAKAGSYRVDTLMTGVSVSPLTPPGAILIVREAPVNPWAGSEEQCL